MNTQAKDLVTLSPVIGEGPVNAAEHDAWFREQVQQALNDANQPEAVFTPHEIVMKNIKARLDRIAIIRAVKSG